MRTPALKTVLCAVVMAFVIGSIAPQAAAITNDWSLTDVDGETFQLSGALTDGPVLLLFWATWCTPCKKELGDNQALFDTLAAKGLNVILVAEDNAKTQSKVKPYVASKGYQWRTLLDPSGEVLKRYGGANLPFSVLLDEQGNVVQTYKSAIRDKATLTTPVENLLKAHSE